MEWEGVITAQGDRPLGTLESVEAEITDLFPGLSFEWSALGVDKRAGYDARGVELPDMVRRVFAAQPSFRCANRKVGPLSVSFNLGAVDPVTKIWATAGGKRTIVEPALARLQQRTGWVLTSPEPLTVKELQPNELPDLSGGATLFVEAPQVPSSPRRGKRCSKRKQDGQA